MTAPTEAEPGPRRRSWLGLLVPALLAFAVLIGLGVWQIQRKAWKEGLIATLTARVAQPPQALPAANTWQSLDPARDEYRRVKFNAELDNDKEALIFAAATGFRPDVSGVGYWVFTPARLADGSTLMINRGFVPDGRRDPKSRPDGEMTGQVEITGACAGRTSGIGSPQTTIPRITCGSPRSGGDRRRQRGWTSPGILRRATNAGAARRFAAARQARRNLAGQSSAICGDLVRSGGGSGRRLRHLGIHVAARPQPARLAKGTS